MSAGPNADGVRLDQDRGRAPNASAERSCSTASAGPTVSTVAVPPPASATRMASSTAQVSCALIV